MSKPPRFFIDPSQISGDRIIITGDDLRHIRTVLRRKPGDQLLLLDGKGGEYLVSISELRRDAIDTAIVERAQLEVKGPRIILGQGLPKADKMDLIVQKATELGVSSIVPLVTERTNVKVRDGEKRVMRWQKIAREAAMQSQRPDIPTVEQVTGLSEFLDGLAGSETSLHPPVARGENEAGGAPDASPFAGTVLLIPWEEGTQPIKEVLRSYPAARTVVVLIGPEGGFSLNEANMAREKGFRAVSLGPTILRTETAAIAALSMIGYELRV
jgi:16S rRNA (uracil1498-N3)-methyltransferase